MLMAGDRGVPRGHPDALLNYGVNRQIRVLAPEAVRIDFLDVLPQGEVTGLANQSPGFKSSSDNP